MILSIHNKIVIIVLFLVILSVSVVTLIKKEEEEIIELNIEGFEAGNIFKIIKMIINLFIVLATFPMRITTFLDMFMDLTQGIVSYFENVGYVLQIQAVDIGMLISEFFIPKVVCGVEKMGVIHECILFYIWDFVVGVLYFMLIVWPSTMLKMFTGIDVIYYVHLIWEVILMIDDIVYDFISVNIFRYSKETVKKCYLCEITRDKPVMEDEVNIFMEDYGTKIPNLLLEPIGYFKSAANKFLSVFDMNM